MELQPIIIAHRGASAYAPENTMASFKKALDMKAEGIELDVHLSMDGQLVVIHDEKVDRTSNGKGWIKEKTLEELRGLDFGSWYGPEFKNERIPTLEEVMELLLPWEGILNIEIKNGPVFYPGIEEKVADVVRKYGMTERIIISSFNHYSLVDVKKITPEIKTGLLYCAGLYAPWKYASMVGADAIHPPFCCIDNEIAKDCRDNGIAVNTYTVDQPEHIKKMALAGVNGIITNVPDVALNVIEKMGG